MLVSNIYKTKKMFAFDETKNMFLVNAHTLTRKYM